MGGNERQKGGKGGDAPNSHFWLRHWSVVIYPFRPP